MTRYLGRGHQRLSVGDAVEDVLDRRLEGLDAARPVLQQPAGAGREEGGFPGAGNACNQGEPPAQLPGIHDLRFGAELVESGNRVRQHPQNDVRPEPVIDLDRRNVHPEAAGPPPVLADRERAVDRASRAQDAVPARVEHALDQELHGGRIERRRRRPQQFPVDVHQRRLAGLEGDVGRALHRGPEQELLQPLPREGVLAGSPKRGHREASVIGGRSSGRAPRSPSRPMPKTRRGLTDRPSSPCNRPFAPVLSTT